MSNYTLNTGKKYIKDIFSGNNFYNIPDYQRPYVWGKEEVEALLDDLTEAMERSSEKEYFLGCMIWNTKKTESKDGESYEYQDILDGQQRFITLYMLHGVLRDLSKKEGNEGEKFREHLQQCLYQERNEYSGIPARNRIQFEIRDDADFLRDYLITEGGTTQHEDLVNLSTDKKANVSVRNMAKALGVMHKWWKRKSKEEKNIQEYIKKFFKYLSQRVLALYLATPDNLDDAYNLFTVLNSRGVKLTSGDILRAQNLREIKDIDTRKAYAKKWEQYQQQVGKPYTSFDDFLFAIIHMKMKYTSDDNKSLKIGFEFLHKRNILTKGVQTFQAIEDYCNHFTALTEERERGKEGYLFSNLLNLLTYTAPNQFMTPLMYYRSLFGEHRILDFLIKLDNLCSAIWITNNSRILQSRMFILMRVMDDYAKSKATKEDAADMLLNHEVLHYDYQDENANTFLDINTFFEMLDQEQWGAFNGVRVNKLRYLLLKLDILHGSLNSRLTYTKGTCSVEHIMPRKPEKHWSISEATHEEWLHRLGNLALVNRRKNTSLSNKSFAEKKSKYKGSIESRANTNWLFMTYEQWGEHEIKENHNRVIELLRAYYTGNNLETVSRMKKELDQGVAYAK